MAFRYPKNSTFLKIPQPCAVYPCPLCPKAPSPPPNKTGKITIRIKDAKGVGDFIWSES